MKEAVKTFYLLLASHEKGLPLDDILKKLEDEIEEASNRFRMIESLLFIQNRLARQEEESEQVILSNEIAHMQDHAEGLLEVVYGDGPLSDFEFHLEEMLGPLDMRLPNLNILIRKLKS